MQKFPNAENVNCKVEVEIGFDIKTLEFLNILKEILQASKTNNIIKGHTFNNYSYLKMLIQF